MSDSGYGVVFNEEDYVGVVSRMIIILVDSIVIGALFWIAYLINSYVYENYGRDYSPLPFYIFGLITYVYATFLKTSQIGTLGQIVTKTRILHISGRRPNIFLMTYRLLFWIFGPINFISDIAWINLNKEKRTLRDSFCNTIMVKRRAIPVPTLSKIRAVRAFVFGFYILYESANA